MQHQANNLVWVHTFRLVTQVLTTGDVESVDCKLALDLVKPGVALDGFEAYVHTSTVPCVVTSARQWMLARVLLGRCWNYVLNISLGNHLHVPSGSACVSVTSTCLKRTVSYQMHFHKVRKYT